MDPLREEFREADEKDEDLGFITLSVGQIVKIKGVEFKIRKVTRRDVVLRPVDWSKVRPSEDVNRGYEKQTDDVFKNKLEKLEKK